MFVDIDARDSDSDDDESESDDQEDEGDRDDELDEADRESLVAQLQRIPPVDDEEVNAAYDALRERAEARGARVSPIAGPSSSTSANSLPLVLQAQPQLPDVNDVLVVAVQCKVRRVHVTCFVFELILFYRKDGSGQWCFVLRRRRRMKMRRILFQFLLFLIVKVEFTSRHELLSLFEFF